MLFTQKKYKYIISPVNIGSFLIALVLVGFNGYTTVKGTEVDYPLKNGIAEQIVIKKINTIEKQLEMPDDLVIQNSKNPFSVDHKDWLVAQNKQDVKKKKKSELDIEVKGIIMIGSKTKAIVKDREEKNGRSFRLSVGDFFKGYTVVYISKTDIIFQGKDNNIRFRLKQGRGKLYEGKGEIFVVADIDAFLEELENEQNENAAGVNQAGLAETTNETTRDKTADDNAASRKKKFSANGQSEGTGTSKKSSGITASGGGGSSDDEITRADELKFIEEIMKIFKGN